MLGMSGMSGMSGVGLCGVTISLPKLLGVTKNFGNASAPPKRGALARQELTQIRNGKFYMCK